MGKIFYTFRNNSHYNDQFTWAHSIAPRSKKTYNRCPDCGVISMEIDGRFDVSLEGGSEFPDILGCGEFPYLIVSERVVNDWASDGIDCFTTYEVGIHSIDSAKLRKKKAPQYFRVEITGTCKIDMEKSGLKVVSYCPRCHHKRTDPMLSEGFKMVTDSWDGSDLFRDEILYPRVSFCTELVFEIAKQQRHTNFRFEFMKERNPRSMGIDYLT